MEALLEKSQNVSVEILFTYIWITDMNLSRFFYFDWPSNMLMMNQSDIKIRLTYNCCFFK